MWYFVWIFGVGFVVLFVVMNVMWGEMVEECCVLYC